MNVLTVEDAKERLGGKEPDVFACELSARLEAAGAYLIPSDSGAKVVLSRFIARLLPQNRSTFLCLGIWNVWPSSENLDLFYGYRRSHGESRPLIEAPVHVFESAEEDAFVSILCMAFYFVWDAWIFDIDGTVLIKVSHDEWLEGWSSDPKVRATFTARLMEYGMKPISG